SKYLLVAEHAIAVVVVVVRHFLLDLAIGIVVIIARYARKSIVGKSSAGNSRRAIHLRGAPCVRKQRGGVAAHFANPWRPRAASAAVSRREFRWRRRPQRGPPPESPGGGLSLARSMAQELTARTSFWKTVEQVPVRYHSLKKVNSMPSLEPRLLKAVSDYTAEATNSEADPSDSAQQLANINNDISGHRVHRLLDRFKQSLIGGLLRISGSLKEAHNAEAGPGEKAPEDDQTDENAAVEGGAATGTASSRRKLTRAALAMKKAEKLYSTESELYSLQGILDDYRLNNPRVLPKSLRFLVTRSRRRGRGDSGSNVEGEEDAADQNLAAVHPLLDRLVVEFCQRMGMMEAGRLPVYQERMFLWLSREQALRMLADIGGTGGARDAVSPEQVFFINQVNLDRVLTDLQCLVARLSGCVASEGQCYPGHWCRDPEKIREQHRGPSDKPPKVAFIEKQSMCHHIYMKHDFGQVCSEPDCPQRGKRMCTCFQENLFIPDTIVLATKKKFEYVCDNMLKGAYGDKQRWLIRAASLKGGNGVQLIDSAAELETFVRYDLHRRLRGQFFVLQRHLTNPQLLEGRRFDLRMFLLVSVLTDRRVVAFLHPGYIRIAQREYEEKSNDLRCHFTWPFTWDPDYSRYGREKTASNSSADYCRPYDDARESLGLPSITNSRELDSALWPTTSSSSNQPSSSTSDSTNSEHRFLRRLHRIVNNLASQIDSIVGDKPGSWQLFGLDLMLDANKEIWLHDVMTYPGCDEPDARSDTQNRVLPAVLTESLALVFELNQRDKATRDAGLWLDLPDVPVNQPGLICSEEFRLDVLNGC
uniref:TAZ-type domain-containing protein n=1 Tax=Macrostomum lignano TaxID=282301 RepID=A0A1I8I2H5_9PLAT